DLEARPWLPGSGWPITADDLAPGYRRAQELFGLLPQGYDAAAWERPGTPRLPLDDAVVRSDVFQFADRTAFAERHVGRLAAVGPVAAEEYEGWREMVRTLDLAGPEVVTVPLADEVPDGHGTDGRVRDVDADPLPLLVSAGGLGPRGNQLLVLRAANTLWRSGLHFQLVLLGYRRDAPAALERQITRLREAGCPVAVLDGTDATQLRAVLERARCLVDVPQHDPIGLHSLVARALGVPVLGGPHGRPPVSVGEGAVTDPDDSTSLAEAIRPFVRPGRPAGRTPRAVARTWQDYADDLWAELAEGSRTAG
ncbi:glycosyltransferase family 4 protein, partial [Cellulomonas hominis]|nr:glycosyltransferase family 4 protein [Cellulomonas hominis]